MRVMPHQHVSHMNEFLFVLGTASITAFLTSWELSWRKDWKRRAR
jgi:hypothetical protein